MNNVQVIIPSEKIRLFLDWFDSDLIGEDSVPIVYRDGVLDIDVSKVIQIKTPPILGLTKEQYNLFQELTKEVYLTYSNLIVKFNFMDGKTIQMSVFSKNRKIKIGYYTLNIEQLKMEINIEKMRSAIYGVQSDENIIAFNFSELLRGGDGSIKTAEERSGKILNSSFKNIRLICSKLLIGSMWYLVTIKNSKTTSNPIQSAGNTEISTNASKINIRKITTPIYNLGDVRETKEKLIARKKGWHIGCNFNVRGHYRHYKDGKVVFIKQYEKGKGLFQKESKIRLEPKG